MSDQPNLGHNAPPPPTPLTLPQITDYLEFAHADLKRRRDQLLDMLKEMTRDVETIDDDEVLAAVSTNMALVDKLVGKTGPAERARQAAKDPFWEGGKRVDTWFKGLLEPLISLQTQMQARCDAYTRAKIAKRREAELAEARRLQAEAELKAAEAVAAMKDAQADPNTAGEALEKASDAAELAAQAVQRADAKPAEASRIYTDSGVTVSVKRTWKWRVVDFKKVPDEGKLINEQWVRDLARDRDRETGKPLCNIPGVEFYSEETTIRR